MGDHIMMNDGVAVRIEQIFVYTLDRKRIKRLFIKARKTVRRDQREKLLNLPLLEAVQGAEGEIFVGLSSITAKHLYFLPISRGRRTTLADVPNEARWFLRTSSGSIT
jgi:hypothetical protein